jgi:hypothetical protein
MKMHPQATKSRQLLAKRSFANVRGVIIAAYDETQRPPPETPGRLQQSLTNYPNRPTAERGGGSLHRTLSAAIRSWPMPSQQITNNGC